MFAGLSENEAIRKYIDHYGKLMKRLEEKRSFRLSLRKRHATHSVTVQLDQDEIAEECLPPNGAGTSKFRGIMNSSRFDDTLSAERTAPSSTVGVAAPVATIKINGPGERAGRLWQVIRKQEVRALARTSCSPGSPSATHNVPCTTRVPGVVLARRSLID